MTSQLPSQQAPPALPPQLPRMIGEPERAVQLRQGVITAVATNDGTCSVRLGGTGATPVAGVRRLSSSGVTVGMTVWVLQQGYDLLVIGPVATHQWGTPQWWEGIELYHSGSTPFIDFHRAASPAGDGGADYNVRLINEASGYLVMYGGTFKAPDLESVGTVYASNWFRSYGDTGWYSQTWGGGWHMTDASWIRAYNGKHVHTNGMLGANVARMGLAGFADHAEWSHANKFGSTTQFGFIHRWDGLTVVNSNQYIVLASNNSERMAIDGNGTHMSGRMVLRDNAIWTRVWNDDWHVMGWSGVHDGLRITEYGGLYFRVRDQDPHIRTYEYAVSMFIRFDQLGGWDTFTLRTRSQGGGSPTGIAWHEEGRNAAHIIKSWFSALECRNWDNGGWGIFRGELEDYSSAQSKKNITRQRDRLPKADRRRKQKRIEAAHFNRRRGGCANCMGTGLAKENRRIWDHNTKARHHSNDLEQIVVGDTDPCPDCGGRGMAFMHAHDVKNEEAGWFGFISEEVEKEFPEACYYRPSEADNSVIEVSGLSVQALVALLWEDNKDQQEEIDALEARLKKLEGKA